MRIPEFRNSRQGVVAGPVYDRAMATEATQTAPAGWFGIDTDDPYWRPRVEGSAEKEKRSCYEG
jgi:hypothetical protein